MNLPNFRNSSKFNIQTFFLYIFICMHDGSNSPIVSHTAMQHFWTTYVYIKITTTLQCRNSSVGRALDWRSKGPWFNPGFRQCFFKNLQWHIKLQFVIINNNRDVTPNKSEITFQSRQKTDEILTHQNQTSLMHLFVEVLTIIYVLCFSVNCTRWSVHFNFQIGCFSVLKR